MFLKVLFGAYGSLLLTLFQLSVPVDEFWSIYTAVGNYANEYHALYLASDISLAVIDMSLPDGGLFDIYGNWTAPHELHKAGKSVDFSKYYVDHCSQPLQPIDVIFYNPDGSELMTTNRIDDD